MFSYPILHRCNMEAISCSFPNVVGGLNFALTTPLLPSPLVPQTCSPRALVMQVQEQGDSSSAFGDGVQARRG
ncbi:hypothetical protein DPEC_G00062810 [Dallia pectoralis]|uniref:Uncharacterized protein n=1 Tax=Dallia pectoralis TaxID=75939 RepID=A0ACC2H7A9_DALPE|nr:hypothetical protein DPEC_G00062810 [Dallia pectoralis]